MEENFVKFKWIIWFGDSFFLYLFIGFGLVLVLYLFVFLLGSYFANHFVMAGERFDNINSENFLFGENNDLNYLSNKPVPVSVIFLCLFVSSFCISIPFCIFKLFLFFFWNWKKVYHETWFSDKIEYMFT